MKLRIGELARRSGLTVRTLRHYDALGLLTPNERTEAEHRLYSQTDLARLLQIQSLKALGLSLEQIRTLLDDPGHDPRAVLRRHICHVEARLHEQRALLVRLRRLEKMQQGSGAELLEVIRMTEEIRKKVNDWMQVARMVGDRDEDGFNSEQMDFIRQRAEGVSKERTEEVQNAWPELMAEVLTEMERGTDPQDPKVKALAVRWQGLVHEFTGGRKDIQRTLSAAYDRRMPPDMQAMWDYISRAMK